MVKAELPQRPWQRRGGMGSDHQAAGFADFSGEARPYRRLAVHVTNALFGETVNSQLDHVTSVRRSWGMRGQLNIHDQDRFADTGELAFAANHRPAVSSTPAAVVPVS